MKDEALDDQPEAGDPIAPFEMPLDDSNDEVVHDQPPALVGFSVPWRYSRVRQPSTRYVAGEYVLLTDGGEPESFKEAMDDEHNKKWIETM